MSWEMLPTNFTDAVWSGLKRYQEIVNEDGTKSFQDVTQYSNLENSFFGALIANRMNTALNQIMTALENGTDLYEVFQQFFSDQQTAFSASAQSIITQEQSDVDSLYAAFQAYVSSLQTNSDDWFTAFKNAANTEMTSIETGYASRMTNYENVQQALFNQWFAEIKSTLSDDVAGQIINRMDETDEENFKKYYGLIDKVTTISTDAEGRKTILENGDGAVATTTFADTATGGKTITTLLVPDTGDYKYTKTVSIEKSDGTTTITEKYTREVK